MEKTFRGNKLIEFCHYCSIELLPYMGKNYQFLNSRTIDHMLPTRRGGINGPKNKALCCYECNQIRNNIDLCREFETKDKIYLKYVAKKQKMGLTLHPSFLNHIFGKIKCHNCLEKFEVVYANFETLICPECESGTPATYEHYIEPEIKATYKDYIEPQIKENEIYIKKLKCPICLENYGVSTVNFNSTACRECTSPALAN